MRGLRLYVKGEIFDIDEDCPKTWLGKELHFRKAKIKPITPSLLITNASSINNKFCELVLHANKENTDIIIISETWLDKNTPWQLLNFNDYFLFRADRDSHGGGVAIWSWYKCAAIDCDFLWTLKKIFWCAVFHNNRFWWYQFIIPTEEIQVSTTKFFVLFRKLLMTIFHQALWCIYVVIWTT